MTVQDRTVRCRHLGEREGLGDEDPQGAVLGEPGKFQARSIADLGARVRAGRAAHHFDAGRQPARERGDGDDPGPVADEGERDVDRLVGSGKI